ncbi:MAG: relaxase/mobilization nuclease domain-containing protein [Oscillospiraceae bacterium]|nr:relaxase/mobilization nuclease domain-containing protein [Oscillospiraceae bacterium]
MKMVYKQYAHRCFDEPILEKGKGRVKAIHHIQSFSPDENITPEQAHRIAKAFVRKTFGDDCQAVIATHTDKKHIHSHIIINTYSLSGHKFNDNQKTLTYVRKYSDRVCLAFGIQSLQPKQNNSKGSSYAEWENKRKGTSWKEQIRMEIDGLIPIVKNVDELFAILEERGYTVKRGKYISVKAPRQQRAVRLDTLGVAYSLERLGIERSE